MNKRYYWLKLNEDFFEDDTIKWLEEQPNGVLYVNFYLKLCLKSLTDAGKLVRYVGQKLIPYDIKALSSLTNVPVDTVTVAMRIFLEIGLVSQLESGEIYMNQINEMIGSETDAAKRVRKHRALASKNEKLSIEPPEALHCNSDVTKCNTDIDIEIDIEKDIDIDIDKEKEVKKKTKKREPRHKHGEYNHILLTDKQYEKLVQDYTEPVIADVIKRMDEWCQMQGRSYKDYNLAIRKWLKGGPTNKTVTHVKQSEFTDYEQRDVDYNKLEKELLGWE